MKHYIKATALCLHLVLIVGLCACEEQDGSASGAVSSEVMDGWINNAWTGFGAFCAGDEELAMVSEIAGANAATYGEIMPEQFREVANWMGLGKDDVFMDMGSGVGKTVAQAWLEYGVQLSVGVELVPSRHAIAVSSMLEVAELFKTEYPNLGSMDCFDEEGVHECCFIPKHDASADWSMQLTGRKVEEEVPQCARLLQGDMLKQDLENVTTVWISSLCMGPEQLDSAVAKLEVEAPKLRRVASIKRLPGGLLGFEEEVPLHLPMSWTADVDDTQFPKDVAVHLYSRSPEPADPTT